MCGDLGRSCAYHIERSCVKHGGVRGAEARRRRCESPQSVRVESGDGGEDRSVGHNEMFLRCTFDIHSKSSYSHQATHEPSIGHRAHSQSTLHIHAHTAPHSHIHTRCHTGVTARSHTHASCNTLVKIFTYLQHPWTRPHPPDPTYNNETAQSAPCAASGAAMPFWEGAS